MKFPEKKPQYIPANNTETGDINSSDNAAKGPGSVFKRYPKYVVLFTTFVIFLLLYFTGILIGNLAIMPFIFSLTQIELTAHYFGELLYKNIIQNNFTKSWEGLLIIFTLCAIISTPSLIVACSCFIHITTPAVIVTAIISILIATINLLVPENLYNKFDEDFYILTANTLVAEFSKKIPDFVGKSITLATEQLKKENIQQHKESPAEYQL